MVLNVAKIGRICGSDPEDGAIKSSNESIRTGSNVLVGVQTRIGDDQRRRGKSDIFLKGRSEQIETVENERKRIRRLDNPVKIFVHGANKQFSHGFNPPTKILPVSQKFFFNGYLTKEGFPLLPERPREVEFGNRFFFLGFRCDYR